MENAYQGNPPLTGGLIASVELVKNMKVTSEDEIKKRLSRVGTVDLRVDYLRAGKGRHFVTSGSALRKGSRVAVIRTEMFNDKESLIDAGTGTYLIG